MNWTNCFKILGASLFFALLIPGCDDERGGRLRIADSPQQLLIGRMRVSIWPEYDDRSILAVYDGKLDGTLDFPLKTSFLVPKGAVINDACSLSVDGQHFCQLYKTVDRGAFDEISLLLPYPNFYLSFHTPQIDTETEKRELVYRIKANHAIKTMNVDIQQPLRATEFSITPPDDATTSETDSQHSMIRGFTHFGYTFAGISEGQETGFKIAYLKTDPNPSVDIKYASMEGPKIWGSPYEAQKNVRTVIYILFGTGTLGVLVVTVWLVRRRKTNRHETST